MDTTEGIRREMVGQINSEVQSASEELERARLERVYGQVWNTRELSEEFEVLGFMAPFITVRRKSDNKKGSMMFQHHPRFYFAFAEA